MLALLLAVALIGLTLLALLLAGVLVAAAAAIAALNLCLVVLGLRARAPREDQRHGDPEPHEQRWRPSAFRLPPEPPVEADDASPVRIYRG
ncbi:MAG TPA: hypothetical protein VN804_03965 [Solirubrobacteraceae bacterium]|nr:hypothetical protein [Solirubrobacteraceae bacterium]